MAILEDPLYLTGVLERLDLEKYREVFEKHEINYDAFKLLKEENLNQLKIIFKTQRPSRNGAAFTNYSGHGYHTLPMKCFFDFYFYIICLLEYCIFAM